MKKSVLYIIAIILVSHYCVPSPTKDYIDNFENTYGSLSQVENLVFEAKFDSVIDSTIWTGGSHHYDFRSGNDHSQTPQFLTASSSIGSPNSSGSTTFTGDKYNDMSGILLTSPLKTFTVKNGQSISVKFDASLSPGAGSTYNKVIIILSTATTKENFKIESSTEDLCNDEVTGEGVALVYETDRIDSDTRYLRVERLENTIKGFGKYLTSTTTCTANSNFSSKFYNGITNDSLNPYANSGFYPSDSWRFLTLNPPPQFSGITETKFQHQYNEDQLILSTETMFIQKTLLSTDSDYINDADMMNLQSHEVTIKPDSTIEWKFNGNTYILSGTNFDLNYEYNYVSIKIQEDALSPVKGLTRIKNLIITQK